MTTMQEGPPTPPDPAVLNCPKCGFRFHVQRIADLKADNVKLRAALLRIYQWPYDIASDCVAAARYEAAKAAKEEGGRVMRCTKCDGCGKVADTKEQEPWTMWSSLPPGSDAAVRAGIVKPVTCDSCLGTGEAKDD